ncbi:alanyl-tRNA editing protein [Parendozoicomonas sp. Alg238-R29]|uniref:alanyl-tRNA editing protein n=1 Tax=Parendozoicomonas sp. Alg238-R29 TaxID=2993446 RepID=UPI00248D4B59|nr:alanyl-tRNA editing protein [Parendozoicomonas sp. Alg238-R29]
MKSTPAPTRQLFDADPYQKEMSAIILAVRKREQSVEVLLDQTVFYPTGGGQPGDTGFLVLEDGKTLTVTGTVWDREDPGKIWHQISDSTTDDYVGVAVSGVIDWEKRYRHMRMHTCLHVLSAMVDAPVTGCSIGEEKGRLDFDLPEPTIEKGSLTREINALIALNQPVNIFRMTPEELEESGYFAKTSNVKPPVINNFVRMIGIENTDVQPCGGTHVKTTSEIGRIVCAKIEKRSRKNRRVVLRWETEDDMASA